MDDSTPQMVLAVVVAMMILAVGVFAFFVVTKEIGYSVTQTETFTVSNPTVSQACVLAYFPKSVTLVEQYNGFFWQNVDSAYYSLSYDTVTVLPGGMQG